MAEPFIEPGYVEPGYFEGDLPPQGSLTAKVTVRCEIDASIEQACELTAELHAWPE